MTGKPEFAAGVTPVLIDAAELEQLRRSHALLSNFSRCLPGMFYQFQRYPDGRFCFPYASDAVLQLFGVQADALREDASMLFSRIHPDDLPGMTAAVRHSAETLSVWRCEYRIVSPHNAANTRASTANDAPAERWVLGDSTPEAQADGSVLWHGYISDITARKRAEQQLLAAERQSRLVLKASNQGLYDINLTTGEGHFNHDYLQMLGYTPDDFADSAGFWRYFWSEGVHPDDIGRMQQAYRAHFASHGETDYIVEFRQKNKAGEWRWILSQGCVVEWGTDGRALRMLGTHVDITDRKQTETILQQNQEQLETSNNRYKELARELEILITNTPVGIMFVSDGVIVRANKALAELCHFPDAAMMIGVQTTFLYQDMDDYRAFGQQVIPLLLKDELVELEWRLRRATGEPFTARVVGRALPNERYQRCAVWMVEDITEQRRTLDSLRQSEHRLQRLMNHSLIGIVQGRGSKCLLDVNNMFVQLSGYTREELLEHQKNWTCLLSAADQLLCRQSYAALLEHGSTAPVEIMLIHRDGHQIPMLVGLSLLENSRAEWVAFIMDISDRLRMNQLKTEFISVVSHELRTPLTSIRGSLSLLESGVAGQLSDQAKHLIKIAHNNSKRLITLVNDILDMDKLANGKMAFKSEPVDLVALAKSAIEANLTYACSLNIRLFLRHHPPSAWVMADSDRLMQVMANLLSNAAKFSDEGNSVNVQIWTFGHRYRVEVSDTGSGIPLEFQNRLFEPFTQADGTNTRQQGGTGLGLSITKVMIEKMHGDIGFESTVGKGSTFWFEFDSHSNQQLH